MGCSKEVSMKKRINVTISEVVYKRLENYRDKLNISRICQEAIKTAIEKEDFKEDFKKKAKAIMTEDMPDLSIIINRLKEEMKPPYEKMWQELFEAGVKDAIDHLSYEDIKSADGDGINLFEHQNSKGFDVYSNYDREYGFPEPQNSDEHSHNDKIEDVCFGAWEDGVKFVWNKIKNKFQK